jgi:hypothetical protein
VLFPFSRLFPVTSESRNYLMYGNPRQTTDREMSNSGKLRISSEGITTSLHLRVIALKRRAPDIGRRSRVR